MTGDSDGGRATDSTTRRWPIAHPEGSCGRRYNGPANGVDYGKAVAVSPGGTTVYVTGQSDQAERDYATVAYSATAGRQL